MMVFADFHIDEEEKPFEDQQGTRPKEHRARKKSDLPKVDLARPKDSDKKASRADEKEIAQDIGRVYPVIRVLALADCHGQPP